MKEGPEYLTDDLAYLSDEGYALGAHRAGDVKSLKSAVRSRFGDTWFLTILGASLFVIMTFSTLYLSSIEFTYPAPTRQAATTTVAERATVDVVAPAQSMEASSPSRSKTLKTTALPVPDPEATSTTAPEEKAETLPAIKGSMSLPVPEAEPAFTPNAPVIYIEGCKITEYGTLYFNGASHLAGGGVDASFSGDAARTETDDESVPLHTILRRALLNYRKAAYRECLYDLSRIRGVNSDDINCAFYTAMCQYHLGRCSAAIPEFDRCLTALNNTFQQEALFYKALSLDSCGDRETAGRLMKLIADAKGFYASRAMEWLDRQ